MWLEWVFRPNGPLLDGEWTLVHGRKKKHQFEQVRLVSTHHIKLRLHLTKTYFAKFRLEQDCYHTTFNKTHLVKITRHIRTNPKIYTLNVNEQSSKQGTKYNRIHSSFHPAKQHQV